MSKILYVHELIAMLQKADKNAVVVISSFDHSFKPAYVNIHASVFDDGRRYEFGEDLGEAITPEKNFGKRIPAVIVE